MSLNIKNQRVHDLAREAARRTGKTQTGVIEEALERLLEDYDSPSADTKRARIDAILADIDANMTDEMRAAIRRDMDDLYDENGLPQ